MLFTIHLSFSESVPIVHNPMLINIIIFNIIGSIFSLGGGVALLLTRQLHQRTLSRLTSFAAGVLLATAFADLLPEALETGMSLIHIAYAILAGIVGLFLLERTFLWYHRSHGAWAKNYSGSILITIGDSVHNFIDGVGIAGAFLISYPLGVSTALAVAAHEIPHEIADFSVMLKEGLSKRKTLMLNFFSALTSLAGALLTFFLATTIEPLIPLIVALTAGMFTYIACADLIPDLQHGSKDTIGPFEQSLVFMIGVGIVFIVKSILHV
jgi:zinc and cadmium transporter